MKNTQNTPKSVAHGCVIKRKLLSEAHAQRVMNRRQQYQRAYKCEFCEYWHITTKLPRITPYVHYFDFNDKFDNLKAELILFIDDLADD